MKFSEKLAVLFAPYWNKSRGNRVKGSMLILSNAGLLTAVYVATAPQAEETDGTKWDPYVPIVVPMVTNAVQTIMFLIFNDAVATALQQSMTQRILKGEPGNENDHCKHLGLIQILAEPEVAADIENIGRHIVDASMYCQFIGNIGNVISIGFYWRLAYQSVPEARNVLYVGSAITAAGCILQKMLISGFRVPYEIINQQDIAWQTRIGRDIRHNDAVVSGEYQNAEARELNQYSALKSAAYFKFAGYFAVVIIINDLISLGLMNIMRAVVSSLHPELNGSSRLDAFSFAMVLLANSLLQVVYTVGSNYGKASVGLTKLYEADQLLKALDDLQKKPYLTILYEQVLNDPTMAIQFQNFILAIPEIEQESLGITKKETEKNKTTIGIREKILRTLRSNGANFIAIPPDFNYQKGYLGRIYGASGVGKSTLFRALHGIWPYASGTISFACKREEIYTMPQEQLFIKGTLLENVFYPYPVPLQYKITDTAQTAELHSIMRQIGLERELKRLYKEDKDWGAQDLSPGLKKRFNFLRMYMKANSGQHPSPKVILLDEMTSGVDGDNALFCEGLIRKLHRQFPEACILFIKHNEDIHPEYFNAEQQQMLVEDPDLYRGLRDSNITELKQTIRPVVAEERVEEVLPATVSHKRRPLFFAQHAVRYNQVADDADLEMGVGDIPKPPETRYRCSVM